MNPEKQQLVTNQPVAYEKQPVEVKDSFEYGLLSSPPNIHTHNIATNEWIELLNGCRPI